MRDCYRLRGVGDDELLRELSGLVARANGVTAHALAHLAELDERRLYLELGFSSLFAYCTESLGLCESAAGRRIAAARVCRRYPDAFELVARGELHLSALCALGQHLTPESASELFTLCARKTRRQIDELLAARAPKPDVREQIRRLPGRAVVTAATTTNAGTTTNGGTTTTNAGTTTTNAGTTTTNAGTTTINAGTTTINAGTTTINAGTTTNAGRRTVGEVELRRARSLPEPLSAGRYGFHFTGEARLKDKIEQARGLARHRLPSGDLAELLELAIEGLIRDLERQRFSVGRKARRARHDGGAAARSDGGRGDGGRSDDGGSDDGGRVRLALPPGGGELAIRTSHGQGPVEVRPRRRSRRVSAAVARGVYTRDAGRCSFVSSTGRCCGSRAFLELDHVKPWAEGGESTFANLRLRCRSHNQAHARAYFGQALVDWMVTRRRARQASAARRK